MKKFALLFLSAVVLLTLAACGGDTEVTTPTPTPAPATPTPATEATPTPTPASAPEPVFPDPGKPMIALTLDDGPNNTVSVQVLDALEKHGVVATYFSIGINIERGGQEAEAVMKRAFGLGCEFGNHSWDYSSLGTRFEYEDIVDSINKTSDKIAEVLGEDARPKYFRAPNLSMNDRLTEIVTGMGLPFMEGLTGNDWSDDSPEQIFENIVPNVKDGTIILLHDGNTNQNTGEAMDSIIAALLEDGYQFVTLTQLFESKGVTPVPGERYGRVDN